MSNIAEKTKLKMELEALRQRVEDLQKENAILKQTVAIVPPLDERSDEEIICEGQLRSLREEASYRALTLEETKRLDLLVKNLGIARAKKQPKNPLKDIKVSEADIMEALRGPNVDEEQDF